MSPGSTSDEYAKWCMIADRPVPIASESCPPLIRCTSELLIDALCTPLHPPIQLVGQIELLEREPSTDASILLHPQVES